MKYLFYIEIPLYVIDCTIELKLTYQRSESKGPYLMAMGATRRESDTLSWSEILVLPRMPVTEPVMIVQPILDQPLELKSENQVADPKLGILQWNLLSLRWHNDTVSPMNPTEIVCGLDQLAVKWLIKFHGQRAPAIPASAMQSSSQVRTRAPHENPPVDVTAAFLDANLNVKFTVFGVNVSFTGCAVPGART